jgi:hypothetical protein
VLKADSFGEEEIQAACEQIQGYTKDGVGVHLVPSVQAVVIEDMDSFKNELNYLFKPINVKTAYVSAWTKSEETGVPKTWELNSKMKDFFTGHAEITKGRMMVKRFGTMHGHCKDFIGIKPKKEKAKTLGLHHRGVRIN